MEQPFHQQGGRFDPARTSDPTRANPAQASPPGAPTAAPSDIFSDLAPRIPARQRSSGSLAAVMSMGLSLGGSVHRCERTDTAPTTTDTPTVVAHNFHNRVTPVPGHHRSVKLPLHVDPTPQDSLAICQLPLMALGPSEISIIPRPIPGAIEYTVSEGLAAPGQIICLDPASADPRKLANDDLISMAAALPIAERSRLAGLPFVSAFTTASIREQAAALGMVPIQRSDSVLADNKSAFLLHAEKHGVQVCEHYDFSDINAPSKIYSGKLQRHGGWVKVSNAMGGCGLSYLDPHFTPDHVSHALARLRGDVQQSLIASRVFSEAAHELVWPHDQVSSPFFPITIEVDASCYGEKILVGSSVVEINRLGTHRTHAYFQQIIGEGGEFLGSALLNVPSRFGASLFEKLEDQAARIARLACDDLGFAGIAGIDFIVVQDEDRNLDVRIIELNARPPISATSYILGSQKLGASAWRAPYLVTDRPIVSMLQLEQLLTIDGKNLTRTDPDAGRITPLHFGTLTKGAGDSATIVRPANWCQVLISAASEAAIDILISKVQGRGEVRFGRPNW